MRTIGPFLDLGSKVGINEGVIQAIIIGMQIFPDDSIQYRVEWFRDGEIRDTWLYPMQIEQLIDRPELKIGFHPIR